MDIKKVKAVFSVPRGTILKKIPLHFCEKIIATTKEITYQSFLELGILDNGSDAIASNMTRVSNFID